MVKPSPGIIQPAPLQAFSMAKASLEGEHDSLPSLPSGEVVPIERPFRPLLYQAGIIDLNDCFSQLPQDIINDCGVIGAVKPKRLARVLGQMKAGLMKSFGLEELTLPNLENQHALYPILSSGIIADMAKTKIFATLLGKHQLGLNRFSPLPNPQNRGEHSIYVAVKLVRTLQHLDDVDHKSLVDKLRGDFKLEGFDTSEIDDENILSLTVNLATAVAITHDLMIPAGGDAVKYLLRQNGVNMDEEQNLEWFLSDENKALRPERDELLEVLDKKLNLTPELISYMLRCVQGKSDTLIGELINPVRGDKMDGDREGYTELDNEAATIFDQGVPDVYLPPTLSVEPDTLQLHLAARLTSAVVTLYLNPDAIVNPTDPKRTGHPDGRLLPVSLIDCSEKRVLSATGELVCTDPVRLGWAAVFRDYMTIYHYAGAQMLGLESELQDRLQELWRQGIGQDILSKENLLAITDARFLEQLINLNDPELLGIIERAQSIGGTSHFAGQIVDTSSATPAEAYKSFPLNPKPGFDSRVQDGGGEITLGEHLARHPTSGPSQFFAIRQEHHRPSRVDVFKVI